jgi:AcrR family transcriptional regulator
MSARAKTSDREIREALRRLLEKSGERSLSMQMIAAEVGIRAPSLYKRFAGKRELMIATAQDGLLELAELLRNPADGSKTYESLERMGHLYRKFAKKNPRTYALIFREAMDPREELLGLRHAAAEPMLALLTPVLGKDEALHAMRLLVSYLHGFLSMELARTFHFGGNVNEAFQYGLSRTLDSLLAEKAQHG